MPRRMARAAEYVLVLSDRHGQSRLSGHTTRVRCPIQTPMPTYRCQLDRGCVDAAAGARVGRGSHPGPGKTIVHRVLTEKAVILFIVHERRAENLKFRAVIYNLLS